MHIRAHRPLTWKNNASYLVFSNIDYCLVAFPLVALRNPTLPSWSLSDSISLTRDFAFRGWGRCGRVERVVGRVIFSSLRTYSSIIEPPCTRILLEITTTLSENDILMKLQVRYAIKNRFREYCLADSIEALKDGLCIFLLRVRSFICSLAVLLLYLVRIMTVQTWDVRAST